MKRMKRKPTENQQAYKKEVQRIKRWIREAEKRGYLTNDNFPQFEESPARVTKKMIDDLKRLKAPRLYHYVVWLDRETGEVVEGRKRREYTRTKAYQEEKRRKTQHGNDVIPPNGKGGHGGRPKPPDENEIIFQRLFEVFEEEILGIVKILEENIENGGTGDRSVTLDMYALEQMEKVYRKLEEIKRTYSKGYIGSIIKKTGENSWKDNFDIVLYSSNESQIEMAIFRLINVFSYGVNQRTFDDYNKHLYDYVEERESDYDTIE